MKKTKALVTKGKNLLKEVEKMYNAEMKDKVKKLALRKVKQVKMAEITVKKLKQELNDLITGKHEITEEELLFEDED